MDQYDQRIAELARRSSNFGYLLVHEPLLVAFGTGAEVSVYDDPNGAMVKARQFGEVLAGHLIGQLGLRVEARGKSPTQAERVRTLVGEGVLVPGIERAFDTLRRLGNRANHEWYMDARDALGAVRACFELGQWFHLALTGGRQRRGFVPPAPTVRLDTAAAAGLRDDLARYRTELAETRLRLEGSEDRLAAERAARGEAGDLVANALRDRDAALELVRELDGRLAALAADRAEQDDALALAPRRVRAAEREAFVERARRPAPLNEAEARRVIDRMLADAGWRVQDYAELNPMAAVGVAV
ncbi:MAG TPA: hypothetical protein VFX70_06725, partial [Mycobacteriales bacterium]|nr:hypothetical protein [Mycobacteriales bacterium]